MTTWIDCLKERCPKKLEEFFKNPNPKGSGKNSFEDIFANLLAYYGFWARCDGRGGNGQTCDIFAAKNGKAYLIEAKVCAKDCFDTKNRIPNNQHMSMQWFRECGNNQNWFVYYVTAHKQIYISSVEIIKPSQGVEIDYWLGVGI